MKLGMRECTDVILRAKGKVLLGTHVFQAGEPVLRMDTAKTSSLEGAATTVYATGGRGNAQLLAWEGEKTLTFTLEDALISPLGMAILTGADLVKATKGTPVIAPMTETLQLTEDGVITLTHKPSDNINADAWVTLADNNGEPSGTPVKVGSSGVVLAENVITCSLFKKGDVVMVDYYKENTNDAQEIQIAADKFAGYYYLEASTLARRQVDGYDLAAQIIIPKVKIQSNFSFTLSGSGDPSSFTFTMDAFADYTKFDRTKKVLCVMQFLEADDNYDLTSSGTDNGGEIVYERVEYDEDSGVYIRTTDDLHQDDTDKVIETTGASAPAPSASKAPVATVTTPSGSGSGGLG